MKQYDNNNKLWFLIKVGTVLLILERIIYYAVRLVR